MTPARTLFDKVWDDHVISEFPGGEALIYVDRHILHDLTVRLVLPALEARGLTPLVPELTFATADHAISSTPGRSRLDDQRTKDFVIRSEKIAQEHGLRFFGVNDPRQGIVHVISPELGMTLPGSTIVCTDSHTCTQGAFGAMAWGIGTTDSEHVMATQSIPQTRPKQMRVWLEGRLLQGVTAKDVILALIGRYGAAGGTGYAIEFAGSFIRAASMEERMTLCNMAVEFGARIGLIAPDETTFGFLEGREFAPKGNEWDMAVAYWKTLPSDEEASFDREITFNVGDLVPHVTFGTSPEHVVPIDQPIPDPAGLPEQSRAQVAQALDYMGVAANQRLDELLIDWAFIGSCTNSRLSDLRAAAEVFRGRHVASGVRAWVVPGSTAVKRAAEAEGLDRIFIEAGVEWRESGCSLCCAVNGDVVPPGQRCISTSNRNFIGRQGDNARTHLASPAVVAASAIKGRITDPGKLTS